MWLSTLPRRFVKILDKILDRHERSGIAVQWNGGWGGGVTDTIFIVNLIPTQVSAGKYNVSPRSRYVCLSVCPWSHFRVSFVG